MGLRNSLSSSQYLEVVLRRGLVIKIGGNYPFEGSPHPHRFVVLNYNPDTKSVIIATHATSNVKAECEKAERQGEDVVKTVVYFKAGKYRFLPEQTVFNCNELEELAFDQLVKAMDRGDLEVPPDDLLMDEDIDKLVEGAIASSQTSQIVADMLMP